MGGTNAGSCKVFSMGKLLKLPKDCVLLCFAEHYKQVLGDPEGTTHGNIRAFMKHGWDGVEFPDGLALAPKEELVKARSDLRSVLCDDDKKFSHVLELIEEFFEYVPRPFKNGETESEAGTNAGSCKVLAMGKLLQ